MNTALTTGKGKLSALYDILNIHLFIGTSV